MSQEKPPERSGPESTTSGPATPKVGDVERTAPLGKPRVSLGPPGLGRPGDTVRPTEPVVSYGEKETFPPLPSFLQDRETLPPPVPMEQLVAQMMTPDAEMPRLEVTEDLARLSKSSGADTLPPPASDVDTVRTRSDQAKTIPPTGDEPTGDESTGDEPTVMRDDDAKTIPPGADDSLPFAQNDVPTLPPPGVDDADTIPPGSSEIEGENASAYRGVGEQASATSVTAQAMNMAQAVFQEIGVELQGRESGRESVQDEPPRTRPPEEIPRSRIAPSSRVTPTRTMRPVLDAQPPPPSAVSSRVGSSRRKPSEPGLRSDAAIPAERVTPSPTSAPMTERLNEVRERYEAADYRSALTIAESILATHPDHIAAVGYAESSRQMLRQKYLTRLGDTSQAPRIRASTQELVRFVQDERVARVVKSIDGSRSIDDIVGGAGMPTTDALAILHDLLLAGVIEVGMESWGRR